MERISFDHLVGTEKDRWWNGEADFLHGLEVHDEIEFPWPKRVPIIRRWC